MRNMAEGLLDGPEGLERYKINQLPDTAYYIPDFISEDEEEILLSKVSSLSVLSHGARKFMGDKRVELIFARVTNTDTDIVCSSP